MCRARNCSASSWRLIADGRAARYGISAACLALALIAAALGFAWDRLIATIAVIACAGAFLLLRAVSAGVMVLLRKLKPPKNPLARLALANLHRPGAATQTVIISLGLGVTLIVALAMIDATVSGELTRSLPKKHRTSISSTCRAVTLKISPLSSTP